MKKFYAALTCAALLWQGPLSALLPPLWEGVSEIKAILTDEHLKDYLDSAEIIEQITKVSNGYLIKTNRSELLAEVKTLPQERPGPAKFEIQFSK